MFIDTIKRVVLGVSKDFDPSRKWWLKGYNKLLKYKPERVIPISF